MKLVDTLKHAQILQWNVKFQKYAIGVANTTRHFLLHISNTEGSRVWFNYTSLETEEKTK